MYVLHAWKSSLQLFKPSNLKLFALVTLKNTINTYKNYFKYGWPFLLAAYAAIGLMAYMQAGVFALRDQLIAQGASEMAIANVLAEEAVKIGALCILLLMPLTFLCRIIAIAFARPSVDKKNCVYMRTYLKRYWWRMILQGLISLVLLLLVFLTLFYVPLWLRYGVHGAQLVVDAYKYWSYTSLYGRLFTSFINGLVYVPQIFSLFFLLDLERSFRSLFVSVWFGIKMVFYNLPFVIIASIVLIPVHSYVQLPMYLGGAINVLIYPLIFCFIGTYYTKKVHDQARLYQGN